MSSKKTSPKVKVGRDSGSGRFVTQDYAKKHPKTTEIESYPKKKGK